MGVHGFTCLETQHALWFVRCAHASSWVVCLPASSWAARAPDHRLRRYDSSWIARAPVHGSRERRLRGFGVVRASRCGSRTCPCFVGCVSTCASVWVLRRLVGHACALVQSSHVCVPFRGACAPFSGWHARELCFSGRVSLYQSCTCQSVGPAHAASWVARAQLCGAHAHHIVGRALFPTLPAFACDPILVSEMITYNRLPSCKYPFIGQCFAPHPSRPPGVGHGVFISTSGPLRSTKFYSASFQDQPDPGP